MLQGYIEAKYSSQLVRKSYRNYNDYLNHSIDFQSDRGANNESQDSVQSETSVQLAERMTTPWVADSAYAFLCLIKRRNYSSIMLRKIPTA